jgi:hypothetical protein
MNWKYTKAPIDPEILRLAAKFSPAVIWVDGVRYDMPKKKYFDKEKRNG